MARITERADEFAKKFAKQKEPVDNRSTDEKLAEFSKIFMPDRLKEARKTVKRRKT